jgi:putative N6-adenine-specific DNA methylase
MADFYLVIAPGLEVQALSEIKEVWPFLIGKDGLAHATVQPKMEVDRGGIEFSCEEVVAYQLNFFLKTPTRLLQRIKKFRSRDFPKVFQDCSKVQWNLYLSTQLPVSLNVSAQKSRLNNEKRLESVITDVLKKAGYTISDDAPQALYMRMDNDECTISIDTSGEMLYRRGWGAFKGEAPMRETLASFCLRELLGGTVLPLSRQVTLVDPFCGSGTLLLEGASQFAPHWGREFSFIHIPSCPKIFKSATWRKNFKLLPMPLFKAFVGGDIDEKTLEAAKANTAVLEQQLLDIHPKWALDFSWHLGACSELKIDASSPIWLVSNPPYGGRVSLGGSGSLAAQVENMLLNNSIERIGLLLPQEEARRLDFHGFEKTKEIEVINGGLKTFWTVWCKK